MSQFIPLLLLQCVYLLRGENADAEGSGVMRGVVLCKRWCERRNWCSEATCNVSIECTGGETPLTRLPNTQHHCETCPRHQVCMRTIRGATKCVLNESSRKTTEGKRTSDGRQTGFHVICKGGTKSCVQTLHRGHNNKKTKYYRAKTYVDLIKVYVCSNVVYYTISATYRKRDKLVPAFDRPKIYYWVMTIRTNNIESPKNTGKSLSFQLAVTNQIRVAFKRLKQAKVFKGFTITVSKHITFKSLKDKTFKIRGRKHYRFVVVLDKLNGRMFLGNRRNCHAVQDSIDVRVKLYLVVVGPSRSGSAGSQISYWFNYKGRQTFSDEDVGNLMRRCEHDFASSQPTERVLAL